MFDYMTKLIGKIVDKWWFPLVCIPMVFLWVMSWFVHMVTTDSNPDWD